MHKKDATLGGISLGLRSVGPDFIAQATRNIEKLDMKMTSLEATFLIKFILKGSSSFKSLYLRETDLSSIDPETLTGAVTKMKEVNLCDAQLTPGLGLLQP